MTSDELYKLGIVGERTGKAHRHKLYFYPKEIYFIVPDIDTAKPETIIECLVMEAFEKGRLSGNEQKAEEIRDVLNIKK